MYRSALKRKKLCNVENEDRISDLPDCILRHILSFLPTICSVRTSCLSRRWRFLWTTVPALEFRDTYHSSQTKLSFPITSFSNFVNRALLLCASPCLQRFCLHLSSSLYSPFDLNSWIQAALIRHVEQLDLYSINKVKLPHILFNSEKLVTLVLGSAIDLNVPSFVNLPSLKTLHLSLVCSVSLSDASINRIISGCPILQDLVIERSNRDKIQALAIESSSLKRFALRRTKDQGGNKDHCSVTIDAPKLEILSLVDEISISNYIDLKSISSMSKASLRFFHCQENLPQVFGDRMVQILQNSNIDVLSVNVSTLFRALVDTSSNNLLCCGNMKHLTVRFCGADLKVLPDILSCFPNLQVLTLVYLMCNHAVPYEDNLKEKKPEIYCLNHSLKKVKFPSFNGKEVEMRLAEYFLKNGKVLHKIKFESRMKSEVEVLKKLIRFPRSSDICEVVVS